MDNLLKNQYKNFISDSFNIYGAEQYPECCFRKLIERLSSPDLKRINMMQLPHCFDEKKLLVKIYRVRKRCKIFSRLKKSRAICEGEGYRFFNELGIKTAQLVMYGEQRKWRLFQTGVVVTVYEEVDTITEAYLKTKDFSLLMKTSEVLGMIHNAGVTHGDPRTRNFLATSSGPLPFDLPSWSKLLDESQKQDLVRFLGSANILLKNTQRCSELLDVYNRVLSRLPCTKQDLLHAAEEYSNKKLEP